VIIIIDGYNLLKLVHGTSRITEQERSAFVNLLGRYKVKRGHKIVIVFDAGPSIYTEKQKQRGVDVIYSGQHHSADDVIMKFVANHACKDLLVITADNEIIGHAKQYQTEVIDPHTFYHKVKEAFTSKPIKSLSDDKLIKLTDSQDDELDKLMQEAANFIPFAKDSQDEYTILRHHQPKGATLSKRQRRSLRKIDKL